MAQIVVTGLSEVLSDHEDRIAAAQAWCVQQNIRSIDELKSRGDAAEAARPASFIHGAAAAL